MSTQSWLDSNIKPLFHGATYHPTYAQRPPGMANCAHGIIGFAPSTPPTHIFFYLFLASAWSNSYVSDSAVIHHQLRQADITDHLFLGHLDFAHIVPYLALTQRMNIILSLSVQFFSHSDKYHTFFNSRTSSMQSFFAQKDRTVVYKFVSDCLDMINT